MKWPIFIFTCSLSLNIYSFEGTFEEVKKNFLPSDVKVYDRDGRELETIRVNDKVRSLEWTSLNKTSFAFKNFLISSEDQSFYDHSGVDLKALFKAFVDRIKDKNSKRGASTITMQLINLLHPEMKGIKKDVWDKIEQIKLSIDLEKRWTKDQILEAYINLTPFKGELLGIAATSYGLFQKAPAALNNDESALLVAMIRSPNAQNEIIAMRACRLLKQNNCQKIYNLTSKLLSKDYSITRVYKNLNILDESIIKKNIFNNNIYTTIDFDIQRTALTALHEQIKNLKSQNMNDGAVLVIDNKTNEILAYVPNSGDGFSSSPRVDNIRAYRQAGSTLKPFIYALAFDRNLLSPNSLIDDAELDVPIGNGSIYYPKNYDNKFHGVVEAKVALGSSLNVPAVKTLMLVKGENVVTFLNKLGFKNLKDAGYYGPSLALGSVDVSLWDLTHGYSQLSKTKLLTDETKKDLFNVLTNADNRKLSFGTSSILSMPFNVAVKTGTSKDMRDNWCVGYTKNYTIGVWVGNSNGKPMWNVSGVQGAAPILRSVFMSLEKDKIHQNQIAFNDPIAEKIVRPQILKLNYPVNGEIIGFDSEIPSDLQLLPIEIDGPKQNIQVKIDDQIINPKDSNYFWKIVRGKHLISLSNASGEVVDQVAIEVR